MRSGSSLSAQSLSNNTEGGTGRAHKGREVGEENAI